jgi:ribonucleoside-triphosphate reductase
MECIRMATDFAGFSDEFLAPYRKRVDPFQTLLARCAFMTKYSRGGQSWTDTIARVVIGNVKLDPSVTQEEADILFTLFWEMKALPPGRGLWTGGIEGMPPEARYNCWGITIRDVDDWCWTANMLMLGGGVGVGLQEIDKLPDVVYPGREPNLFITCDTYHPNADEVKANGDIEPYTDTDYKVADSRQGWVEALRVVMEAAFAGSNVDIDVSGVRPRGLPIKTFGGTACGPGPLVDLLRAVWSIIRDASGRKLNSVECLDITNHIGLCIKSGNVRRSALIVLGDPNDHAFRDAKKSLDAINSHRHTSNNSLAFTSWTQLMDTDWRALVEDNATFGEPGIANLVLCRTFDSNINTFNPCGEVGLWDRESCNLGEVFPALCDTEEERHLAFTMVTRYCLRQRLTPMSDPMTDSVRKATMRLGVAIGGLCDFEWTPEMLKSYYDTTKMESMVYAKTLGVNVPIAVTCVKPSGTISLLNGSSPGIHAPFAPFYVRRMRLDKDEPMALAMMAAGVPWEPEVNKESRLLVFSFPMAKPGRKFYVSTETIRDQIERQVVVQESWADNAVSATLSFEEHEKDELAACLKQYVPRLKSTSCLPKAHGYAQPPYEEITEEEYHRLSAMINHTSQLVRSDVDVDFDECSGGVCPVR